MRKRGLCCRPVSVRPSVTLVYSIHTAEDIIKLLSPPGSPITLVFWSPAPIPSSKGNPFIGGAKYTGWEKIAIFDRNRRLSRKLYEIGPWLPLIGSHMRSIEWWHFQWPSRTFIPVFKVTAFFMSNISKTFFDPRLTDKLLLKSNRKPYIVYRMVPSSMTFSDLWPGIQGHDIFWSWISEKRRDSDKVTIAH